jgi:hypothetical protein
MIWRQSSLLIKRVKYSAGKPSMVELDANPDTYMRSGPEDCVEMDMAYVISWHESGQRCLRAPAPFKPRQIRNCEVKEPSSRLWFDAYGPSSMTFLMCSLTTFQIPTPTSSKLATATTTSKGYHTEPTPKLTCYEATQYLALLPSALRAGTAVEETNDRTCP